MKGSGSTLYISAADGKRYVFPTLNTYLSWYPGFSNVISVSDETLGSIPIGGNVTYRPGLKLIKITTDPKVYAVSRYGVLRWVTSESLATLLYGANWAQQVDDIPDEFFVNYTIGAPIYSTADYSPTAEMNAVSDISQNISTQASTPRSVIVTPTPIPSPTSTSTDRFAGDTLLAITQPAVRPPNLTSNQTGSFWVMLANQHTDLRQVTITLYDEGTGEILNTCTNNTLCWDTFLSQTPVTRRVYGVATNTYGQRVESDHITLFYGEPGGFTGTTTFTVDRQTLQSGDPIALTVNAKNVSASAKYITIYDERDQHQVSSCENMDDCSLWNHRLENTTGITQTYRFYAIVTDDFGRSLPRVYSPYVTVYSSVVAPANNGELRVDRVSIASGQMTQFTFVAPDSIPTDHVYVEFYKENMNPMVWSCPGLRTCTASAANWSNGYADTRYYALVYNRAPGASTNGTLVTTLYSPHISFTTYTICPTTTCTYAITPGPLADQNTTPTFIGTTQIGVDHLTINSGDTMIVTTQIINPSTTVQNLHIRVYDERTNAQVGACDGSFTCVMSGYRVSKFTSEPNPFRFYAIVTNELGQALPTVYSPYITIQ